MEESTKNKIYAILEYLVIINGIKLPKLNLFTLGLKEVYPFGDETYLVFIGILPNANCINLNFMTITHFGRFEKNIQYSDLTPEFLYNFKKDYENLIDFYYQIIIEQKKFKSKIKERFNDDEHDGSDISMRSTKNKDIDFYFIKGFNYNTDLNDSQKEEFQELFKHHESLWDMRLKTYDYLKEKIIKLEKERLDASSTKKNFDKEIYICKEKLKIKEKEDNSCLWYKINKYIMDPITKENNILLYWDSPYEVDNLLRFGIEDKLGMFTKYTKYNNASRLFEKRKKQLIDLKGLLEKDNTMCDGIMDLDYINIELKKYDSLEYDNSSKEKQKINDEKNTLQMCNTVQWTKNEENGIKKEIIGNDKEIKEILNSKPFLYQMVDFINRNNPLKTLPLNKRQYVFGFYEDVDFFRNYRQYFRSLVNNEPWYSDTGLICYRNLLYYSQLLNKLETVCATETDIMFPFRFLLKNPFNEQNKRLLNRLSKPIQPIQLLKYKLIGIIHIKRFNPDNPTKDDTLYNFIYLNTESRKSEFRYSYGKFSHFAFIQHSKFLQVHFGNIYHLRNITWDEFNTTYKYLEKKIYCYKKDIDEKTPTLNVFIHNTKHPIPPELCDELVDFDDNIYSKLNIAYKNFYDSTNPDFLLYYDKFTNENNIIDFFKTTNLSSFKRPLLKLASPDSARLDAAKKADAEYKLLASQVSNPKKLSPRDTTWSQPRLPESNSLYSNKAFSSLNKNKEKVSRTSFGTNTRFNGGAKLFYPEYISNYKIKFIYFKNKLEIISNNDKNYKRYLLTLFDIYSLLNNKLIKYIPNISLSIPLLSMYESIYNNNLIYKNNMEILEINNLYNFTFSNCVFIANKKNIKINCDSHLFKIYDIQKWKDEIFNTNVSTEIIIKNNYITKDTLKYNIYKKYDLIFCIIKSSRDKFWYNIEENSLNIKFIFIIYSLLRLKKYGTLHISNIDISTLQSYQIINNLIPYFENIIIYNIETTMKYKQNGTDVICKKFKDNFKIDIFMNLINKIFQVDNTLGNEFENINNANTLDYNTINIYLDNYAINKNFDQKLLNDIKLINKKKHFFVNKSYYDVIDIINKFKNSNTILDDIVKYYDDLRLVCSYMKGKELDLIDNKDDTPELKKHVKETIKKLKENKIIIKNIAIYKKLSQVTNTATINLEKLKVIQEFYHIINDNKKEKKTNIFDLINFDAYKQSIYSLLEKNKDLYISYNTDDLYNFEIIHKKDDNYVLTTENKNFIENILISYFNEVIDTLYEKQNINYYLDMYKL